jgi:phosphoglycolate phosphatase-like HAD superfamily hydrolase
LIKYLEKYLYIFDFDGVLVDSVDVKTQAFAEIYRTYGNEVVDKVVTHHLQNGGMNRCQKFRYYHSQILGLPVRSDEIEMLSNRFSKIIVKKILACKEIAGTSNLLEYCKQKKIVCAINSATPQNELEYLVLMRGWHENYHYIMGSPESKYENLNSIINKVGCKKKQVLFFGDSKNDYSASVECKVDFVGINYFSTSAITFPCFKNFYDYLKHLNLLN